MKTFLIVGASSGIGKDLTGKIAPKIRVNCIAPSLTDTPLASPIPGNENRRKINSERHPLKRTGKIEDIGDMAEFLLSERYGWITGQVYGVDGGISVVR